ncbi:hypothetical protein P3T36_002691 [Kitasatospora sp. MAP12-15]|uniref:hypothetical protein n=1 Tax=unclassified Kitasatospora TaxID=2633591 RepID=UPI002472F1D3|nr:hypothetical protein [Kitasatospora sp. MAP12-44]MDH6113870.1 hypothetical protein [Kitasatospora sp. MAP12-44]
MPGSVTIGHTEAAATIEHTDAQRLAELLDDLGHLLAMDGPNRMSDAQVGALCEGRVQEREALARWCRTLAAQLHH